MKGPAGPLQQIPPTSHLLRHLAEPSRDAKAFLQILNKGTKAVKADFNPNMRFCQYKTVADFGRLSFSTAGLQTTLVAP